MIIMSSIKKIYSDQRYTAVFMILSIILIILVTYKDVFDCFFISYDVLPMTERSRIQSFKDIISILAKPHLEGVLYGNIFYRPIAALSFGLDHYIWKLDPFGYHVTDLIIHISVSLLVFFLARILTKGNQTAAWLSAIIFAIHPANGYIVPLEGRQDNLAALFIVLSLLSFIKYLSVGTYKRLFLLISILFYVFASGSKEIAIILPFMVFVYLMIFSDEVSTKIRLINAVKKTAPYIVATFFLLAWRQYVLSNTVVGYFGYKLNPDDIVVLSYFNKLLNPIGIFKTFYFYNKRVIYFIPLIILFISLLYYKRILSGNRGLRTIKILLMTGLLLSSFGIFAYPLIEIMIRNAYYSQGPKPLIQFSHWIMQGRSYPLIIFLGITRVFFLHVLYALLFFFTVFLIGFANYGYDREYFFPASHKGKVITFSFIWLLLPLCVYVAMLNFSPNYIYIPMIPFSIMLSVIFIEKVQSLKSKVYKRLLVVAMAGALLLCFSFITIYNLQLKERSGKRAIFMGKILKVLPALSNSTTITIYNFPENIAMPDTDGIKSWINLNHQNDNVKAVNVETGPPVEAIREDLDFEIQKVEDNNIKLKVFLKTK